MTGSNRGMRRVRPLRQIGLDVGTSSTKIVARDLNDSTARPVVVRIGRATIGYPAATTPTAIAVVEDRLYFGEQAEDVDNATVFRSFKMCMACAKGVVPCRGCPTRAMENGQPVEGQFGAGQLRITASELFVLYLAWLRRQVRTALAADRGDDRFLWNISVPVAQVDDAAMLQEFSRMCAAAARIEAGVGDGVDAGEAIDAARAAVRAVRDAPSETNSDTMVVPETLAAAVGLIRRETTKLGMYAVVDVGAGTTDVAFFTLREQRIEEEAEWVTDIRRQQRAVSFFSAGSKPIGGDDIDIRVVAKLMPGGAAGQSRAVLEGGVRRARSESQTVVTHGQQTLNIAEPLAQAEESVGRDVWQAAHEILRGAWEKRKRETLWTHLPLLLIGGGARAEGVRRHLAKPLQHSIVAQPISHLETSGDLIPGRGLSLQAVEASRDLLLVAEGLSYPEANYPRRRLPSAVTPLGPPGGLTEAECPCGGANEFCPLCAGSGKLPPQPVSRHPMRRQRLGSGEKQPRSGADALVQCPACRKVMLRDDYPKHYNTKHRAKREKKRTNLPPRTSGAPKKHLKGADACERCGLLISRGMMDEHLARCKGSIPRVRKAKRRRTRTASALRTDKRSTSAGKREKQGRCPQCGKAIAGDKLVEHVRDEHRKR